MPHLETDRLIELYYEEVKEQYPNIDLNHFMTICKTPFRYIRSQMEKQQMPTIFVKYFGSFKATSAKISELLTDLEIAFHRVHSLTDEVEYNRLKVFYTQRYHELLQEEDEWKNGNLKSSRNRRNLATQPKQILEIIDDTED